MHPDCHFCDEPAEWEGWYAERDHACEVFAPGTDSRTGLLSKVQVCDEHKRLLNGATSEEASSE